MSIGAFFSKLEITCLSSSKLIVLGVLCFQNSLYTLLRRYSLGILREVYSMYELLLLSEVIKCIFSMWMISREMSARTDFFERLNFLVDSSRKMFVLALIYGVMNILALISLYNISAGMYTIFAQCKILTTAVCSVVVLGRHYSWIKWRALMALTLGVLLFSEPIWGEPETTQKPRAGANALAGTLAVLVEVTLSGFASIYFEKVIKVDPLQLNIWERNFQLALGSFPVYAGLIFYEGGGEVGFFGGWSWVALLLSCLGAAGGLLVALSIKYGDSILKTLATTGAILLSSILDHFLLDGPLSPIMVIAAGQVMISIADYTLDNPSSFPTKTTKVESKDIVDVTLTSSPIMSGGKIFGSNSTEGNEEVPLVIGGGANQA